MAAIGKSVKSFLTVLLSVVGFGGVEAVNALRTGARQTAGIPLQAEAFKNHPPFSSDAIGWPGTQFVFFPAQSRLLRLSEIDLLDSTGTSLINDSCETIQNDDSCTYADSIPNQCLRCVGDNPTVVIRILHYGLGPTVYALDNCFNNQLPPTNPPSTNLQNDECATLAFAQCLFSGDTDPGTNNALQKVPECAPGEGFPFSYISFTFENEVVPARLVLYNTFDTTVVPTNAAPPYRGLYWKNLVNNSWFAAVNSLETVDPSGAAVDYSVKITRQGFEAGESIDVDLTTTTTTTTTSTTSTSATSNNNNKNKDKTSPPWSLEIFWDFLQNF